MTLLHGLSKRMSALKLAPLVLAVLVSCKSTNTTSNQLSGGVADTREKSDTGEVVEISEVSTATAPTLFKDKLVIGIHANPPRDNSGHYYVILNNRRVDGEILAAPKFTNWGYTDGYFIVFDLTPEQLRTATAEMGKLDQARTLTCVHAALKFVKQMTGFTMSKPEGQAYPNALPGETFKLYLSEGFGDANGKRVASRVYRTNKLPLKSFQAVLSLREPEAKAKWNSGQINMKRFLELSSSQNEAELPPLSCSELHGDQH